MKWNILFDKEDIKQNFIKSSINYNNIQKSVVFKFLLKKYINIEYNSKENFYNNIKNYFKENQLLKKISLEEKENSYFLIYLYNDVKFNFKRYIYIFINNEINNIHLDYTDIIFLFYIKSEIEDYDIPEIFKK